MPTTISVSLLLQLKVGMAIPGLPTPHDDSTFHYAPNHRTMHSWGKPHSSHGNGNDKLLEMMKSLLTHNGISTCFTRTKRGFVGQGSCAKCLGKAKKVVRRDFAILIRGYD
nr:hypothetical protein Iba_chr08cCG13430 [Ipomoea batatas]GMD29632.1 hypothetical protein Iba_chr08fCG4980 [Ipomoea batatas]